MKIYIALLLIVLTASDHSRLLSDTPAAPTPAAAPTGATPTPTTQHQEVKPAEATHSEVKPAQTHDKAASQTAKPAQTSTVQTKTPAAVNTSTTTSPPTTQHVADSPTANTSTPTQTKPSGAQHTAQHPVNTDHKPQAGSSEHASPTPVHPQGSGDHPINSDHPSSPASPPDTSATTTQHAEIPHESNVNEPVELKLEEQSSPEEYNPENDAIIQEILKKNGLKNKQEIKQEMEVEKQETEAKAEEEKQLEEPLDPWVLKQKAEYDTNQAQHVNGERFQFTLEPDQLGAFWYDASTNKPGNDIHIDVSVYIKTNNSYYVPNRPDQGTNLKFSIVSDHNRVLMQKDIYLTWSTEFKTPSFIGYNLYFSNNYQVGIMVLVNIERMNKTVESINSTHLDPMVTTLEKAIQEMEQNYNQQMKRSYKSETGFKQREEEHMATMLMLTGIELLAIICTAIVQMFCLRNLLDNRSIV